MPFSVVVNGCRTLAIHFTLRPSAVVAVSPTSILGPTDLNTRCNSRSASLVGFSQTRRNSCASAAPAKHSSSPVQSLRTSAIENRVNVPSAVARVGGGPVFATATAMLPGCAAPPPKPCDPIIPPTVAGAVEMAFAAACGRVERVIL